VKHRSGAKPQFSDAAAAWHLGKGTVEGQHPIALTSSQPACEIVNLNGAAAAASERRGGCAKAALFNEAAFFRIDAKQAEVYRPDSAFTLYVRLLIEPPRPWLEVSTWNFQRGNLFFSDTLGLSVAGQGREGIALAYLGESIPSGVVRREIPLAKVTYGSWLDLVLRFESGQLEFFLNGVRRYNVRVAGTLKPYCTAPLQIGASFWKGNAIAPLKGRMERVALWHAALADERIAALCALQALPPPIESDGCTQALDAYNRFFDASVQKDVECCARLDKEIRTFTAQDPFYPAYHLTASLGWIFDPAGAYFHNGRYHVFSYRNINDLLHYNSLDHYVSEDLVYWRQWPVAPWADCHLDNLGIWLNNHVTDEHGIVHALYTAHGEVGRDGYAEQGIWAQSEDDMLSFTKKKCVVARHHDGHVWKEGDTYYLITARQYGGKRAGDQGDALDLLTSKDLLCWEERGEIFTQAKAPDSAHNLTQNGFMEFPYLLPFGDRDVLMLGGLPVRYWVGHLDRQKWRFIPDHPDGRVLDYSNSFHCFNPMITDSNGPGDTPRRVILAMAAMARGEREGVPWYGTHALPRVLRLEGDHLHQEPVPELQKLRGKKCSQSGIAVEPGKLGYVKHRGNTLEIRAEFEPRDAHIIGLKVFLSADSRSEMRIFFDTQTREYGIAGNVMPALWGDAGVTYQGLGRGPTFMEKNQPVVFHIYLDKCIAESFVNGQSCTAVVREKSPDSNGLDLLSEGGCAVCTSLDIWEMHSAGAKAGAAF